MEGNLRLKSDRASLIVEISRFCFVLLCILGQFVSTSPRGLIFGGAI